MPRFSSLDNDTQRLIREMEHLANTEGKDSPECRKLWRELGKSEVGCFALMNKDGKYTACMRKPTENSLEIHKSPRCQWHGGSQPAFEDLPEETKLAKLKNLRPDASFVTGLYAEESNFIKSLTDNEIKFMADMDKRVRNAYEVPEDGVSEVVLEGLLHRAVLHFRLLNSGKFERGSKHMADPLMDILKSAKELGWLKKEQDQQSRSQSVLDKYLKKLDTMDFSAGTRKDTEEEETPLN